MENSVGRNESRSMGIKRLHEEKSKISYAERSRIEIGGPLKRNSQRREEDWSAASNSNAVSECENDQSPSILHSAGKKHQNGSGISDLKLNGVLAADETIVPDDSKYDVDGLISEDNGCLHDPESSGDFRSPSPGRSSECDVITRLSACLEGTLAFPKRPRGASRKKKSSKSLIPSRDVTSAAKNSPKTNASAVVGELANGSDALISLTVNPQEEVSDQPKDDGKGNRKRRVLVEVSPTSEDRKLSKNNTTTEKMLKKRRKNKDSERKKVLENGGNLVGESINSSQDPLEIEEANLEQNAAHMLSSRFDPECTRSSDAGSSLLSTTNGSKPLTVQDEDPTGSCSSLLDASGRLLRHKKQNFKEIVRRRRRFYEVRASDTDPYWVLKQRIKIFHPLEQNWRFGLVKDYNPDMGKHNVKFDDSNEKWIDLQKERIKLLLFSSEISRKFAAQHNKEAKQKIKRKPQTNKDDNAVGNLKDTEPIISWLTRINQKVRKFSLHKVKKGSFSDKHSDSPLLLGREVRPDEISNSNDSEAVDDELPILASRAKREDRRFSVIYSRRRYCKLTDMKSAFIESSPYMSSTTGFVGSERSVKFNIPFGILIPNQGAMKLRLRPFLEWFWLYKSLWACQHGILVPLWPLVRLEFLIADGCMELRSLSLEGCLQKLVAVLCFLIYTSKWSFTCIDPVNLQPPFCLVTFKLLGKGDRGRCLVFMAHCLEVENSKWIHLDRILKRHALTRQITFSQYSSDSDMIPHLLKMPSLEALKNGSSLDHLPQTASQDCNSSILTNAYGRQEYLPGSPSSVSCSSSVPAEPLQSAEEIGITDNCQNCNTVSAQDCQENHDKMTENSYSLPNDPSGRVSGIRLENRESSIVQTTEGLSCFHSKAEIDDPSVSSDGDWRKSSHNSLISDLNMYGSVSSCKDLAKNRSSKKFLRSQRLPRRVVSWRVAWKPHASPPEDISSPDKSDDGSHNYMNSTFVQKKLQGQVEVRQADQLDSDLTLNPLQVDLTSLTSNDHGIINTDSPHNHYSSQYGTGDFLQDGFSSSYRKPRTQVSYSLPLRGYELNSNSRVQQRKVQPYKKIKTDSARKAFSRDNPSLITCEANILVSEADRGWREQGALVVLGTEDQDWKILVKLSGETKYTHKADQFLQPGITNRYTHAMMWKGGNNWMLEFTDRGQWAIFKEMHEECYNWNIRAASVKNIPIPGVRLIDDNDDNIVEVPFIRPPKYVRQVGTEVDVALNTYNVLYDMGSDDEIFVSDLEKKSNDCGYELPQITEEMFEKAIDMLEKLSYTQQHDELSDDDVETLLSEVGIGTVDIIRSIYEYWKLKRKKKGVPLIRQFQPALWEQYQKQIREWESAMNATASSNGYQVKRPIEKPPIFAFCLRPRGLELLNKGSFQRPHKKMAVSLQQNAFPRERNSSHAYEKKLNKFSVADEAYPSYDMASDVSPWFSTSRTWNSPRDSASSAVAAKTGRRVERIEHVKHQKKNSKKFEILQYHSDAQMTGKVYRQRNDEHSSYWCNGRYPPSARDNQYDDYEEDHDDLEYRLHDAASAAQHAVNMAKLKREKAQWLLHKADLAVHRAAVALITAEAVKTSERNTSNDLPPR